MRTLGFESLETRRLLTATSPFTVVDNSPIPANEISVAVYGQDYSVAKPFYYFDATGAGTLTTANETIPTFLLSSIEQPGGQFVLNLPQDLGGTGYGIQSARMYFSFDTAGSTPISITTDSTGKVEAPAANNSYFDFIEFSLNAPNNPTGNLNVDTTAVDQFGLPISLDVDPSDPSNPNGVGVEISRDSVLSQYQAFTSDPNDPFAQSLWPVSGTYGPYRILNPSDVLGQQQTPQNIVQVKTTVQAAIAPADNSIEVYDAAAFPSTYPFSIVVDAGTANAETMTVTGATTLSNTDIQWAVTRTNRLAHSSGAFATLPDPAVTATQTNVTLAGDSGFPTTFPFYMQLDTGANTEVVQATASTLNKDGTVTYAIVRGQAGTKAVAHDEGVGAIGGNIDSNPLNSYFNAAIDNLFEQYSSGSTLTLKGSDGNIYTGTVTTDANGLYVLRFKSSVTSDTTDYDVYYPFFQDNALYYAGYTPEFPVGLAPLFEAGADVSNFSPSNMVFACNGVFADDKYRAGFDATQQSVLGNLENQIVSALNRGVALLPGYNSSQPGTGDWLDATKYYVTGVGNSDTTTWNHYAQFMHMPSVSIDGKNYGFAFDDQQGHASDIAVGSFTNLTITLGAWTSNALVITGQAGDDVAITFQNATNFTVDVNGTTTAYTTATYNEVIYNGPAGAASKVVFDDPNVADVYNAAQSLTSTEVTRAGGTGFQFQGNGVSTLYVYTSNSGSTAQVNVALGTGSNNFFVNAATGGYSYIANPIAGIYSELSGFPTQAAAGSGGTTYAYVYSTSHASFTGDPTGSTFTVGGVTSSFSNFPQVYAIGAADGTDSMTLDSVGGTFVGTPNYSYVGGTDNGSTFLVGAVYAAHLAAQASASGKDTAVFYSYAGNTFTGAAGSSELVGSTTNVAGSTVNFVSQANGYLAVSVFESGSGTDVANLTSSGGGSYYGTSTAGALTVGTSVITVNSYAESGGQISAVLAQINVTGAGNGTDTADIFDAPGSNALTASGSTATLTNSVGTRTIDKFGSVTANQQDGTDDTVHQNAPNFALHLVGTWTSV